MADADSIVVNPKLRSKKGTGDATTSHKVYQLFESRVPS